MKPFYFTKSRAIKPVSRIASEYRDVMVELDTDLLNQHPLRRSRGRWRGRFIIAAWVRFPEGLKQRVNMLLVYRDSEHRKSFKIDVCRANRQSLILLNGTSELDVVGEVSEMALVLEGLAEDSVWILDEFRFEPTGTVSKKTELKQTELKKTDVKKTKTLKELISA